MKKANPNYRTPKHGEVVGYGFVLGKGYFSEVWNGRTRKVRRIYHKKTSKHD